MRAACLASVSMAAVPASADPDFGAYLAARQAAKSNDFTQSSRFLTQSLLADTGNMRLQEEAVGALVALGQFDRALPVAEALVAAGSDYPIALITLSVNEAAAEDWAALSAAIEGGRSIGPLVDNISRGWALMGEGKISEALASFDAASAREGMTVYGLTHKAYALAAMGDFEGAAAIFADSDNMRFSRQSVIAYAQILSQLDRNADAVAFMDRVFGGNLDPGLTLLRDALMAGDSVAYQAVRTPQQGLSDLYLTVATILDGDVPDAFILFYARAAMHLWPDNSQPVLTAGRLLEKLEQYELANQTYSLVSPDDPAFLAAELGRAEALSAAGRQEAAIEVLEGLSRNFPDRPEVWAGKGDELRRDARFVAAKDAYTRALDLYEDESAAKWFVFYTRGITHHQLDDWSGAEADFRAALALRPDQPQVLNFLGYSLVERGEKMDEALGMIETAAAARPDNGAIVDSLGWVYFQLGRYDEAVVHLERAAALEPLDPVINDHLGDALWAVGRDLEAAFQWQRALSFDPEEDAAARIRDKLARGLDAVLVSEGADPLQVASEEN
ncbi:MAG: tetratricopeptide repeat protein [Yoonia sp.]